MEFKDTSEYVYLSTLVYVTDTLLDMLSNGELTEEQLEKLMPAIEYGNNILNAGFNLNTYRKELS